MNKKIVVALSVFVLSGSLFSGIVHSDTEVGTVKKGSVMYVRKDEPKPFRVENQVGASVPAHVLENKPFSIEKATDQYGYATVAYIDYDMKTTVQTTTQWLYTLNANVRGYTGKSWRKRHSFTTRKGMALKPAGNGWYIGTQNRTATKKVKQNGKTKTVKYTKKESVYIPSRYVKKTKKVNTHKKYLWEKKTKTAKMWFKTVDVLGAVDVASNPVTKFDEQLIIILINGMAGYTNAVNQIDFKAFINPVYDTHGNDLSGTYFGSLHMINSVGQPDTIAKKLEEIYGFKFEFTSNAGNGHSDTTYYMTKKPISQNPLDNISEAKVMEVAQSVTTATLTSVSYEKTEDSVQFGKIIIIGTGMQSPADLDEIDQALNKLMRKNVFITDLTEDENGNFFLTLQVQKSAG